MKKKTFWTIAFLFIFVLGIHAQKRYDKLPENPTPGKCYVKSTEDDTWGTKDVKILVKPTHKKLQIVPAVYKTVEEKVMVRPATKKYVYVPPVFATKNVRVMVEQPITKLRINPAKFSASAEKITIKPKTAKWDYKKTPNCDAPNPEDCLTAYWVETPEKIKTIPISKLVTDATSSIASKPPPKYITVKTQVVTKPATTKTIVVPAQYKTIKKKVLVKNETTKEVIVPDQFKTEKTQVITKKAKKPFWVEVDCRLLEFNAIPIYFPVSSSKLSPQAKRIIDNSIFKVLKGYPDLRIEVASHTDSRGGSKANLSLSKNRAQSVVNYLVSKGISKRRLVATGFGERRLVNKCRDGVDCTDKEHQKNRRTEFRVISK